jgi:hypothetical protein
MFKSSKVAVFQSYGSAHSSRVPDGELTPAGIGKFSLSFNPIAIPTTISNKVQTSSGRKDLHISSISGS